jgi:adenylate kinase family enzyme
MIVFLAGRRGAGKTTLARELGGYGFARVHTTAVAEMHGIEKDAGGVFHGLAAHLGEVIVAAGPRVVVDGCPRTHEQARLIDTLSVRRRCLVVELVADEALSRQRMAARGNAASSIERAQVRWELTEQPALAGFETLRLDAAGVVDEHVRAVLARAFPLLAGTFLVPG